MTEPVRPHGLRGQLLALILTAAVVGQGASWIQGADFSAVTEPALAATGDDIARMVDGTDEAAPSTPRVVAFEAVLTELLGQEGVVFIDARDEGSYLEARMPGALHLDAEAVEADPAYGAPLLAEVPKTHVLVIYCGGGGCDLSMRLARVLVARGWARALVYEGGWQEWTEMGGPTEQGAP